jgi:hypothetical protein
LEVGIIRDVDSTQFLFGGSMYLISDSSEEETINLTNISALFNNMSFEKKIQQIADDHTESNTFQTTAARKEDITSFFKSKKDSNLDVVIIPESGVAGKDKYIMSEISIIYLKIFGNIKLGFIIDNTICNAVFEGFGDSFETQE